MNPSTTQDRREVISDHPMRLAEEIAKLIRSDPVAVSQISEYIPTEELRRLFDLPKEPTASVEEAIELCDLTEETFEDYFRDKILGALDADDLIAQLTKRNFSRADILEALNAS